MCNNLVVRYPIKTQFFIFWQLLGFAEHCRYVPARIGASQGMHGTPSCVWETFPVYELLSKARYSPINPAHVPGPYAENVKAINVVMKNS